MFTDFVYFGMLDYEVYMALTKQKKAYAEARLQGKTQTESAIVAGYSEKCAKQSGYRLERDPDVVVYMKKTRTEKVAVKKSVNKSASTVETKSPVDNEDDPLNILKEIMNNKRASEKDRIEAAKTLALYTLGNPKGVQGGKKDMQHKKAEAAQSKFAPYLTPLKTVK